MSSPRRVIRIQVNGHEREIYVRDADTLLDVLREELQLTGTKRGCDLGTCGCCTVQINGEPVLACLTLAAEAQGKNITTVEGLADRDRFTPLQKAWAHEGASQCGFCTAGFLMTADALLCENPTPTRDEIRTAISGNLCRCTGYIKILDAIEQSAEKHREMRSDAHAESKTPSATLTS